MNEPVNDIYKLKPILKSDLYEMRGKAVLVSRTDGTPIMYGMDRVAAVLDTVAIYGESKMGIVAIYGRGLTLGDSDYGITWVAYPYDTLEDTQGRRWAYNIVCIRCCATSGLTYTPQKAKEAWNRREE